MYTDVDTRLIKFPWNAAQTSQKDNCIEAEKRPCPVEHDSHQSQARPGQAIWHIEAGTGKNLENTVWFIQPLKRTYPDGGQQ